MALSEEFKLDFKFGGNSEFLSKLETLMERIDARFDSVTDGIQEASDATSEMAESVKDLDDSFRDGMRSASAFGEKLKDIASYYLSFQAARAGAERVWSFGMQSMDAYSTQERAENQLKGVLKNRGTLDQFQAIKTYAANIQGRSIYGDEAMIKGAGELATYVKGTESLKSMMDLLTDYAAGMTGGGEVSPDQMESLATGLGMAYDGNYMAMRRKGFDTSKLEALDALQESGGVWNAKLQKKYGADWDKEQIDNFQKIAAEAKKLGGITEQMRVDALKEALGDWEGLSDAVNELDSSALIRFNNKLGDIRENIGKRIYPVFNKLVDTLDAHMPDIEEALGSVASMFETMAESLESHFDEIKEVVKVLAGLVELVAKFPKVAISAALALKALSSGAFSASGQFGNLSKQINIAAKEAMNLNVAAAALAGGALGATSMDTAGMENGNGALGGVLGSVAMSALAGAQAFGVFGAAAGAAAAAAGAAIKAIWDEIDAHDKIKKAESDEAARRKKYDNILELQKKTISDRKAGKASTTLYTLQQAVDDYEKIYGKNSAGTGVHATLSGGFEEYEKKKKADAKRAAEEAKKAAANSKGDLYQQFNNTNIEQNVNLSADIQKVGILLNQNVRAILEKQLKQNREVSLSTGV